MTKGTFAFVGALLLVPALAMAAVTAATHATKGIVKSVDDASLVITKSAKATKTLTFVLNATTVKKGDLAAGARVEVRYRAEGAQNIATAVTAWAPKGKGNSLPKSSK
jgi:hypothetical protein